LSWGRAFGLLGGLSTGQLNCCLPRMEKRKEEKVDNTSRHISDSKSTVHQLSLSTTPVGR